METGVGISNPLFFIGVVEDISDLRKEGRVKVRAFGVHGRKDQIPTESLPWAIVSWGSYDPNYRLFLNDWVFGVFLDGRGAQQPMILSLVPTQTTKVPDPENDGYGAYPAKDCLEQMGPNAPKNFGQPRNSMTHRGEYLERTWVKAAEQARTQDIQGVEGTVPFAEPNIAANPEYPYNRVIETTKHRIEIDDTPGYERVTIHHNSGSYIQMADNGIVTNKSINDKYEINDENQFVHVGGVSNVVIEGDAFVRVNGNKTEEIMGNYTQLIHGHHIMSVGGETNINTAQVVNIRGANVRMQANAGDMALHATQNIKFEADETLSSKSKIIWQHGTDNVYVDTNIFSLKSAEGSIIKSLGYLDIDSTEDIDIISAGNINMKATRINGDDLVYLGTGAANSIEAEDIPIPLKSGVGDKGKVDLPAPVPFNMSVRNDEYSKNESSGTVGIVNQDESTGGDSDPTPDTSQNPLYSVAKGKYSTGEEYWMIIDNQTGSRAQPESGVNTLYQSEERAEQIAARLNAGGSGFD